MIDPLSLCRTPIIETTRGDWQYSRFDHIHIAEDHITDIYYTALSPVSPGH